MILLENRKTVNKIFAATIATFLAVAFLQAETQPMVLPDSPQWADVYDPPYKVPTVLPADSTLRKSYLICSGSKCLHSKNFPEVSRRIEIGRSLWA